MSVKRKVFHIRSVYFLVGGFIFLSLVVLPTVVYVLRQPTNFASTAQTPAPTIPVTHTRLALTIGLHGIGRGGDNVNPNAVTPQEPINKTRTITVKIFDINNQLVLTKQGLISFNSSTGLFEGTLDLGNGFAPGFSTAQIGIPYYLSKNIPGILNISSGQLIPIPVMKFVAGDSNQDNSLSILDYNLILDCFSDLDPARNCTDLKKIATDLTDDGSVNQFDYNLFLRELSVQGGDDGGGITPIPTVRPTQPARATPTTRPSPTVRPTPSTSLGPTARPSPTVRPRPTVRPSLSPTQPSSGTLPAQILNLTNWKITLPTGSSGSPTEIKQPALATFSVDPWFIVSGNAVRFRSPVNGVTTSGSSYPRSELREMANNGTTNAAWSSTTGTHTFIYEAAITAVPQTKKHIVVGQIHDANDDVIVIRLEYPKLFIDINGSDGPTLDANYVLGRKFTAKFVVSGGKTQIFYNGATTPAYTLTKSYSGAYFKLGAYTQSNCSTEGSSALCNANNYGEAFVYQMSVTHQ